MAGNPATTAKFKKAIALEKQGMSRKDAFAKAFAKSGSSSATSTPTTKTTTKTKTKKTPSSKNKTGGK